MALANSYCCAVGLIWFAQENNSHLTIKTANGGRIMESANIGTWGWIWVGVFLLLFVGMGVYGMRKTKTEEDFAVARGSYGPIMLAFAFAATIASGATFMSVPGMAYSIGFGSLWGPALYPIGIYIGMVLAIKLIKRAGDRFRSNSMAEFMGQRYQSEFLRIAFALLSLLLIYYIAAQVVAAATMFEVLLDLNYKTGILVSVGVIALYVGMGGSHADIMTDGVQGVMMVLIALIIGAMFILAPGVESVDGASGPAAINAAVVAQDASLGWDNYFVKGNIFFDNLGLVLLILIAHIPFAMNPHIGKLAFALQDRKQIRTFLLIAIPISSILTLTVLGGLHARAMVGEGLRPDSAIPILFTQLFPPFLAGMLGVGVLSAIMSTSDGLFIAIAVTLSNDLYKRTLAPVIHKHKSEQQIDHIALNISRVSIVLVAAAAVALAWDPPKFLAVLLWVGVGGIVSGAAGPLVIGSMWRRATKAGAIASFCTGVILYAILYLDFFVGWKNPFGAAGTCIITASVVMVVVSLLTRPLPKEHVELVFNPRGVPA
jgi:Na+/proline symporter